MKKFDTIIIGGGFYGLRIAQFLKEELGQNRILVIEKEPEVMMRASYNNQARVHNGYHYPRSVLTALRSRVNFPIFTEEYERAIVKDFSKYYAVGTQLSKVSAKQFQRFYERIGAPIKPADHMKEHFNPKLIEQVFEVEEHAFDSSILKDILLTKLKNLDVVINTAEKAEEVRKEKENIVVISDKGEYHSKYVINTTYSSINNINRNSNLPILSLKHELTEMCLVRLPKEMSDVAFTIMCGPFFSIMPFPDKKVFTLSHVRYTPHSEWLDSPELLRDSHAYMGKDHPKSHYPQMISDVKRFMPKLGNQIEYTGESLWEVKTVLPQSEEDDSRPILYKEHHGGLRNYICIMGGKIDNIYDVYRELKYTYGKDA